MQVALDPVQYGRSGAFSVNLWFKPNNMSGLWGGVGWGVCVGGGEGGGLRQCAS